MNKKRIALALLGACALASCTTSEPATKENLEKLQMAFSATADKPEAGYTVSGDAEFSSNVNGKAMVDAKIKGLEAGFSYRVASEGKEQEAYGNFKYNSLNLEIANEDTGELDTKIVSKKSSASAYFKGNTAYVDCSKINFEKLIVEGKEANLGATKLAFSGLDFGNIITSGGGEVGARIANYVPAVSSTSEEDENYVNPIIKQIISFNKSGGTTEAVITINKGTIKNILASTMIPTDGSQTQSPDYASMVKEANQQVSEMVDAYITDLKFTCSVKFNDSGIIGASLKTSGKIDLSALSSAPLSQIVSWNITLNVKNNGPKIPTDFDTAGYTFSNAN